MSGMMTRLDIQQQRIQCPVNVLREPKVLRVRSWQRRVERAHNTLKYRKNSLIDQMMASFDRWARSIWR